jgi:hypothetical protein
MKTQTTPLSESLRRNLNAYALAASAAGVGVLALRQPAEARIVYTPAHAKIGGYELRFNNKKEVDFAISWGSGGSSMSRWQGVAINVSNSAGNSGGIGIVGNSRYASALRAGVRVGSEQEGVGHQLMERFKSINGVGEFYGPWANGGKGVKDRYLGLEFRINGNETHYGWARLTVKVNNSYPIFTTILTGYAYETIPNKPIITGRTHGKDSATLGRLAQGASGLSNRGNP